MNMQAIRTHTRKAVGTITHPLAELGIVKAKLSGTHPKNADILASRVRTSLEVANVGDGTEW